MKKSRVVASLALSGLLATSIVQRPAASARTASSYPGGIAPTTLTVWTDAVDPTAKNQAAEIAQFNKLYPQITIHMVDIPDSGYGQKVTTALAGGNAPDVWLWFHSVDQFGDGTIQDLTPFMKRDHLDTNQWFQPITKVRFTYKGDYYAVPVNISFSGILYNKQMFAQAHVKPFTGHYTMAQFAALAKKLSNPKKLVWGTDVGSSDFIVAAGSAIPWNFGADVTNANGRKFEGYMNSANMLRVLNWGLDLEKAGAAIPPSVNSAVGGASGPFYTGHVAMTFDALWDLPEMRQAPFGIGVMPFPSLPGRKTYGWEDSIGMVMWSKSQHKDAAWAWLKFMSGLQWGVLSAKQYQMAPPLPAAWQKAGLTADPLLSQFWAIRPNNVQLPSYERSQFYFDCSTDFSNAYSKALRTHQNIKPLVEAAAKSGQACLNKDYSRIKLK